MTETKIYFEELDKKFEISAELIGSGVPFPNHDDRTCHNQFQVYVSLLETDEDGEDRIVDQLDFQYYGSHADWEQGIVDLNADDLVQAFGSFLSDATVGMMDHVDFCSEFGYDEDSRKRYAIWEACVETYNMINKDWIGGWKLTDDEIYDLVNALNQEEYIFLD